MQHILAGAYYVPLSEKAEVAALRKALAINVYDVANDEYNTVNAWSEDRSGYIGIPRQYGLQRYTSDRFTDETVAGFELARMSAISLLDYQVPWVNSIVDKADTLNDMIAMAHTGAGKTVMSLEVIRRLGSTALVIVDQEFLRDQWEDNAVKFLGVDASQLGRVQGSVCDYEGKDIVVAMIQTLHSRAFGKEFYEYFGTIVVDETHTAGAPQFSRTLLQFPAQFRFGVSATPNRRDELQKVLEYNLGNVEVTLTKKHDVSSVRYVESTSVYSWYANISPKTGRFISEICDDGQRNLILAGAILWLYESGRDVLVVSDRIEHLENLLALCTYLGMPVEDTGMVCGYTNTWGYAKDTTPPRRPVGLAKDAPYTPVKLQLIKKRVPKGVLNVVKDTKRVIFATFGMFSKGVDVPRLSAGVDCTPRSQATQVHGRILRKSDGKLKPIWVTIRDVNSFRAEFQFSNRVSEYVDSNAEIYQWIPGKGVRLKDPQVLRREAKQRAAELREAEIITRIDGSNTLAM
jgi:superfamily II DNA or RNA helicase